MLNLPFLGTLSPSPRDQGTKSVLGEFQIPFRRLPGSLLESMKHLNALRELGNIEDAMFESGVDTDLLNTWVPRWT
jgi:hypothetical protein